MSNPITDYPAETNQWMALLEDPAWHAAADAAEDDLSVSILAGRGQVGWMTTHSCQLKAERSAKHSFTSCVRPLNPPILGDFEGLGSRA
jgi:hypothetical protein